MAVRGMNLADVSVNELCDLSAHPSMEGNAFN